MTGLPSQGGRPTGRSGLAANAPGHRRSAPPGRRLTKSAGPLLDALAGIDYSATLEELTASIERRTKWNRTSVRALHPFDPGDCALLQAVNRGEFTINGLRNRDLHRLLYSTPATDQQKARQRAREADHHRALHAGIHQPIAPGLLRDAFRRPLEAAGDAGNFRTGCRGRDRTVRRLSRRIRRGPGRCVAAFPTNPGPRWNA